MSRHTELNEITGELEIHNIFECAHCDEPSERLNAASPYCPNCKRAICPCCSLNECLEPKLISVFGITARQAMFATQAQIDSLARVEVEEYFTESFPVAIN